MRTPRFRLFSFAWLVLAGFAQAQNDGDHLITNGAGQSSLAVDLQAPAAPVNLTIGTAPGLGATLRVRGDQLPIPDLAPLQAGMLCTFRSDVASAVPQSWRMYRDINQIGAIWNEFNHRAFHVQSLEPRDDGADRFSGLLLQNEEADGIWVMNDGPPTGGRAFPHPLQLLDAHGYAALGFRTAWLPGAPNPRGPWSRFHIFHDVWTTRPYFAFRPQMLNGITLTGNSDLAYMGQWFDHGDDGTSDEVDDNSNLLIATSEDALPEGTHHFWDNITFRFFSELDIGDGAASGVEGLEMMRIQPQRPSTGARIEGMVGIGDFRSAGAAPDERLHLLDRTIRIQSFMDPTLYRNDNYDRVLVANPADGRVYWRPYPTGGGGSTCDWYIHPGSSPGDNYMVTAVNGAVAGCPDETEDIGIGVNIPGAKLHVKDTYTSTAGNTTLAVELPNVTGSTATHAAISSMVSGQGATLLGVNGAAFANNSSATTTVGTRGYAVVGAGIAYTEVIGAQGYTLGSSSGGSVFGTKGYARSYNTTGSLTTVYGAYGEARGDNTNSNRLYGVYGTLSGTAGSSDYAGYFNGAGFLNATSWTYGSDQSLKSDIADLPDNTLEQIMELAPKSYSYNQAAHPGMNLPSGEHFGLIAQELQTVFPQLVSEVVQPATVNDSGDVVAPSETFLGVRYTELTAILIKGIQEQQSNIIQLQSTLAMIQEQLAACCANDGRMQHGSGENGTQAGAPDLSVAEERLMITPNPFTDFTHISYYMPHNGRVRLEVSDADGRAMKVLREEETSLGEHGYDWNTSSLAAGTYFVALVVDENVVVKRAVKVAQR